MSSLMVFWEMSSSFHEKSTCEACSRCYFFFLPAAVVVAVVRTQPCNGCLGGVRWGELLSLLPGR